MELITLALILLISGTGPASPSASAPAAATATATKNSMPLTLTAEMAFPIWVDSRAVLTPSGQLNETLFHPGPAAWVKEILATEPVNGCVQAPLMSTNRTNAQPRASLDDSIKHTEFTLLGRVTGRSYGFYAGEPGQLLRIAPELILKGENRGDVYYAFMPFGDFKVGATKICKTDSRYAHPPDIGDEVFTFTPPPIGGLLLIEDPGDIVIVGRGGNLILPPKYLPERPNKALGTRETLGRDELIDLIRSGNRDASPQ